MSTPDPPAAEGVAVVWDDLLDGRLRRLKRGKDYTASIDNVNRQAKAAAQSLGKTAVTYKDQMGKWEYLWVQFVDGRLEMGEACPRCGAAMLEQVQEFFARCASCGSFHALEVNDPSDGRPQVSPAEVAEWGPSRLLSAEGEEVEEISMLEEAVVEMHLRFLRPVVAASAYTWFVREPVRPLRVDCPHVVKLSEPRTVRFALHMGARMLEPGEYDVRGASRVKVDPADAVPLKIDMPAQDALPVRVVDPRAPRRDGGHRPPERLRLHWTVAASPD